jgi:hypothetical protein
LATGQNNPDSIPDGGMDGVNLIANANVIAENDWSHISIPEHVFLFD